MVIKLEWKTSEHGEVKTAFYRPAKIWLKVTGKTASNTGKAFWEATQNELNIEWGYARNLPACQQEAILWITRANPKLWDAVWLKAQIANYLTDCPLALLETDWAVKLGEYCNTPARVVSQHPAIEAHKVWVKDEWVRLNQLEAMALNALTFATDEATRELLLQILGKGE